MSAKQAFPVCLTSMKAADRAFNHFFASESSAKPAMNKVWPDGKKGGLLENAKNGARCDNVKVGEYNALH